MAINWRIVVRESASCSGTGSQTATDSISEAAIGCVITGDYSSWRGRLGRRSPHDSLIRGLLLAARFLRARRLAMRLLRENNAFGFFAGDHVQAHQVGGA